MFLCIFWCKNYNYMNIRDKIKSYCAENNISVAQFARSVNETPQNLNSMLSGKSRLNADILKSIRTHHPSIDLNRLLDDEENDYYFVAENRTEYGESEFDKRLAKDISKVIKILERYQK